MTSNFSFCKKYNSLSVAQYRTILYLLQELLYLSQNQGYDAGFFRFLQDHLSLTKSVVG